MVNGKIEKGKLTGMMRNYIVLEDLSFQNITFFLKKGVFFLP